jgi:hypothetical protein
MSSRVKTVVCCADSILSLALTPMCQGAAEALLDRFEGESQPHGEYSLFVFESPTNAALFAVALLNSFPDIRAVLHTGEVQLGGEGQAGIGELVEVVVDRCKGIQEGRVQFSHSTYLAMNRVEVPSFEVTRMSAFGSREILKFHEFFREQENDEGGIFAFATFLRPHAGVRNTPASFDERFMASLLDSLLALVLLLLPGAIQRLPSLCTALFDQVSLEVEDLALKGFAIENSCFARNDMTATAVGMTEAAGHFPGDSGVWDVWGRVRPGDGQKTEPVAFELVENRYKEPSHGLSVRGRFDLVPYLRAVPIRENDIFRFSITPHINSVGGLQYDQFIFVPTALSEESIIRRQHLYWFGWLYDWLGLDWAYREVGKVLRLMFILVFFLNWCSLSFFTQTPGCRVVGLHIVDVNGRPLGGARSYARAALLSILFVFSLGLFALIPWFSWSEKRGVARYDKWLGVRVVKG